MAQENIEASKTPLVHPQDKKISFLKHKIETLSQVCDNLDPFGDISQEDKKALAEFGPFDYSDPYTLTNQLVAETEGALEELGCLQEHPGG